MTPSKLFSFFLLTVLITGCSSKTSDSEVSENPKAIVEMDVLTDESTQEPLGYEVQISGDLEEEFTFLFSEETNSSETLIEGEQLHSEAVQWAGIESELIFVRKEDRLQIQEEVRTEEGEARRSVLETLELPENLELRFQ